MTIEQLISEVTKINPAINCFAVNGYVIEGNYRGKKTTGFKYDCKAREFEYNNAGSTVSAAFEQALKSIEQ